MNGHTLDGIPEIPENILSRKRQQALLDGPGTTRRIKEKMFAEAVSNFRIKLNIGMREEELRLILEFFQHNNVSVSVAYFRNSDPGIRITSPVINSFISITNPQSIFLVCDILGYRINSSRSGQKATSDPVLADPIPENGQVEISKRHYALDRAAKAKEKLFGRKNMPLLRFFGN